MSGSELREILLKRLLEWRIMTGSELRGYY